MRILVYLAFTFIPLSILAQGPPPNYILEWEDNFDSLNTDIWLVKNHFDHYGGERQVYTDRPENVFIEDGALVLRVDREEYSCPPGALNPWGCARQNNIGEPYEYTSGWIETKPAYAMEYGYAEARIRLPYGRGFWPAFWTFVAEGLPNHQNAAEIDIYEMYGHKPPYILATNVHLHYCNENHPTYPECNDIPNNVREHIIPSYWNTYHVYSIEWTPLIIKWKINDVTLRVMPNPGLVDPVRLIINMAILQNNLPNEGTPFPSDTKIDYVRAYKLNEEVVGIQDQLWREDNFNIYPNPASQDLVYIKSNSDLLIKELRVMNSNGQVISEIEVNRLAYSLDVSELPEANYFIEVNTELGSVIKSLVRL